MKGVVTYLEEIDGGVLRLVMDDVSSSSEGENIWAREMLFTHNDYDADSLADLSLSKEQFAEIGENLVMRLMAIKNVDSRSNS
ncbi:hypothetical protein [Halioxenophilus sp. WMMB6]|uniref:hypothetical protein n=1 Tax=Halioxenophilus sp. WMMB6 TaxID=3073815 RepID=UPI00295E305A|nr:hypothetical protein [Halioxenophilus sp. WMMB6]